MEKILEIILAIQPRFAILSHMKTNFTSQQLEWAKRHDWFMRGDYQSIMGIEIFLNKNGGVTVTGMLKEFTNFQALRNWAGY